MLKQNKMATRTAILVAVLMLLAFLLRMVYGRIENVLLATVLVTVRNTIHVSLLVFWIISLHHRLVNRNVRRLVLTVGGLLLFWLVDKIVKWDFTGTTIHPLVRYLWYGFYVGMLFVPTLGAFVINYLGKPETYKHPKRLNLLLIPPVLLLTAVFTNDLHQQVFVFYNGISNFHGEYGYDWLYFLNMGWFIGMGFYFVIMTLAKSRVPGSKKLQKMPILIMAGAVLFWIGYCMKLYKCDLTVMDCFIIVLLLECSIQSGLLPSNRNYRQIFDATTVPVMIMDKDYQPHYASAGVLPIPEEKVRETENGTVLLGNTLLNSAPIQVGYVIWQDDITQLNALKANLQDAVMMIEKENDLLQAESEVKKKRAKAEEQNRLYDRIVSEVKPQLVKAEALICRIEAQPDPDRKLIAQLSVLGSFIKRRGNLLLLGEDNLKNQAVELEYCLRESLENLRLGDVLTSLNAGCIGELKNETIVAVYDFYERIVESLFDHLTAVMVNLNCKSGVLGMNLRLGCTQEPTQEIFDTLSVSCGSFTYEIMDEDVVVNLTVFEDRGAT